MMKNKKGISVMIGYVLLVTLAVVMGGIVYQWMKTYVPAEELKCQDGVSIFIKDAVCKYVYNSGPDTFRLDLEIQNNGRFNYGGYFIYVTDDESQEVATIDLSQFILGEITKLSPGVKFPGDLNSFEPGDSVTHVFSVYDVQFNPITSIEIIPIRWEEIDGKSRAASCVESKIRESITCTIEDNRPPRGIA